MSIQTTSQITVSVTAGSKLIDIAGNPDIGWAKVGDVLYLAGEIPMVLGSITPHSLAENSPVTASAQPALLAAGYVNLRDALIVINRQSEEFAEWYRKLTSGNSLWEYVTTFGAIITYTLVDGDNYTYFIHKDATDNVVTIPSDATFNFPIGARMGFDRYVGGGEVSFVAEGGVSLALPASGLPEVGAVGSVGILIKMGANSWRLITNSSNYTGFLNSDGSNSMTGDLLIDVAGTATGGVTAVDDNGGIRVQGGSEAKVSRTNAVGAHSSFVISQSATQTVVSKPDDSGLLSHDSTTGTVLGGFDQPLLTGTSTSNIMYDQTGAAAVIAEDGQKTEFPAGAKTGVVPANPEDLINLQYFIDNAATLGSGSGSATVEGLTASRALVLDDSGKYFTYDLEPDIIISVPAILTTDLEIGFSACFDRKEGAGKITITPETVDSIKMLDGDTSVVAPKGVAQLVKRNSTDDQMSLFGQLVVEEPTQSSQTLVIPANSNTWATVISIGQFSVQAGQSYEVSGSFAVDMNGTSTDSALILYGTTPTATSAAMVCTTPGYETSGTVEAYQWSRSSTSQIYLWITTQVAAQSFVGSIHGQISSSESGTIDLSLQMHNPAAFQAIKCRLGHITLTRVA